MQCQIGRFVNLVEHCIERRLCTAGVRDKFGERRLRARDRRWDTVQRLGRRRSEETMSVGTAESKRVYADQTAIPG